MRGLDVFERSDLSTFLDAYRNNWELIRRREKISDFSTFFFIEQTRMNIDSGKNCGIEIEKIKLNLVPRTIFEYRFKFP